MLDGKEGIGKSDFAKNFTLQILGSNNQNHPNILYISREEKKEIGIEQIRQIADFVNKSAATNDDKFVIIDSACQMTNSASNALLKILEEPKAGNYLFLISHNSSKILPTILSRCYVLKIFPPTLEEFNEIARNSGLKLDQQQAKFLSEICDGSASLLIKEGDNLSKIYQLFLNSFMSNKIDDQILKMASTKDFNFMVFALIVEFFVNRLLKTYANVSFETFFNESEVFASLVGRVSWQKVTAQIDEILRISAKTDRFSLDRKISIINIFNSLNNSL